VSFGLLPACLVDVVGLAKKLSPTIEHSREATIAPRTVVGRLTLVNERGENQRRGIFYTPDWVGAFGIARAGNRRYKSGPRSVAMKNRRRAAAVISPV
jgi:hypothetical protein